MSSGAEAQELLCFQSRNHPPSPPPSSPPPGDVRVAAPSAPASPGARAEAGDRGKGRALALRGPWPARSARRCRGSWWRPPPQQERVAFRAQVGEKRRSFLGRDFVLFLESPLELRRPDGSNQNPITTEEEGRKSSTEFSGQSVYGRVCERTCLSKLGDEPWALKPHHSPELSCLACRSMGTDSQSVPQPLRSHQLLQD